MENTTSSNELIGQKSSERSKSDQLDLENKENLILLLRRLRAEFVKRDEEITQCKKNYSQKIEAVNRKYNPDEAQFRNLVEEQNEIQDKDAKNAYKTIGYCIRKALNKWGFILVIIYYIILLKYTDQSFWLALKSIFIYFIFAKVLGMLAIHIFKGPLPKSQSEINRRNQLNLSIKQVAQKLQNKKAEIGTLEREFNAHRNQIIADTEKRISTFNILPAEHHNIQACDEIIHSIETLRANTFAEALNVYENKLAQRQMELHFKQQIEQVRQEALIARENAYRTGKNEGYNSGYQEGYSRGYGAGERMGYGMGKRGK